MRVLYLIIYNTVMKKILLLIAILLAQTLSAQVFRGDSRLFGVEGYVARPEESKRDILGSIRYYIGEKGESTYFMISITHSKEKTDISRNNNVYIEYANEKYTRTQVHSTETIKLSKPYAREKLYETLLEFPVDESELCKRRIKSISIETDNKEEFIIKIGWFWGTYLSKSFPDYFAEAKEDAESRKQRREFLTETFGENIPDSIKSYLEEKYPEQSYNLVRLDTVYMPFSSIALLEYEIREKIADFVYEKEEAEAKGYGYAGLVESSDTIVTGFKEKLLQYEDEFKIQYAAEGGEDDYQLVVVDVISHDGKERITLYTRVGEERPTDFDFKKTANECRARIKELEEHIDRLRKNGSESAGMVEE